MSKLLLSIREAATALGLSRSYVYALCDGGVLPSVRIGHKRMIRSADLAKFAESGTAPDVRIRALRAQVATE